MTHKSHMNHNKKHGCGHIGFGKFCHLCKQIEIGEIIENPPHSGIYHNKEE